MINCYVVNYKPWSKLQGQEEMNGAMSFKIEKRRLSQRL